MSQEPRDQVTASTTEHELKPPRAIALGFELRLVAKVGLLLGAGAFIPVIILWIVTSRFAADTYLDVFRNLGALNLKLIWVSVFSAAGQLLLVGILVSGVALYASHRIAGPLIRLEHGLRGLAHGDLTAKLQFRRGDQDRSLPGAFDALREDVSQRVATARDAARDLRQLVDDAKMRSWTTAEAEPLLRRIQENAKRLRRAAALAGGADAS